MTTELEALRAELVDLRGRLEYLESKNYDLMTRRRELAAGAASRRYRGLLDLPDAAALAGLLDMSANERRACLNQWGVDATVRIVALASEAMRAELVRTCNLPASTAKRITLTASPERCPKYVRVSSAPGFAWMRSPVEVSKSGAGRLTRAGHRVESATVRRDEWSSHKILQYKPTSWGKDAWEIYRPDQYAALVGCDPEFAARIEAGNLLVEHLPFAACVQVAIDRDEILDRDPTPELVVVEEPDRFAIVADRYKPKK